MADYEIQLSNRSGQTTQYDIIASPPMGAVVGSTPFSVVLLESPKVANNGVATFQMKGTLWGVCGTSPGVPLADGGNVRATEAKAFDKMQGETLIIDMQGDQPAFENNVGAGSGVGNQIQTTTFPFDPNFNAFCGVGRQTPDSLITPTAIWLMRPSMMYQVVQQPIFYLFPGNIVPGTIVDFSTATAVSAKIDFTNSSTNICQVIHNADGTFTVTIMEDVRGGESTS